jgi:sn-glycerol 3-phosphate transport system permease protein
MTINQRWPLTVLLHLLLITIVIVNIFPLFWMISSSLKPPNEIFTPDIRLIPHKPTLDNIVMVFTRYPYLQWFRNSLITTLGISIGHILVAVLAAFGDSFFKTKFNGFIFYFIIATLVIPSQVTLIPNFILVSKMNLISTYAGVIIPHLAGASTFYFMRQHFKGVPMAFYEAAFIEGAGSPWILIHVVIPICKSSILVMFILSVIGGWNDYMWPLIILRKVDMKTLTIGLQNFVDPEEGNHWGPYMACATMSVFPVVAAYCFIQKNIIEAFVRTGLK